MHIPDGYLGPQTYVPAYAAMIPIWAIASAKLKKTLRSRQVPMLALGAAFSFLIMMFNIPIPGGTTGHAVGAVLVAVLLGPWAAMIAVSLALIVQALLFGDGGITAIGANCFNMAVVMPFVGWGAYRLIAGSADAKSKRHVFAGAIGGYVGLNVAALSAAIMFGIQPILAHDAAGRALYNPFGLKVAITAMGIEHLMLFGFVEAIVTGLAISYLQKVDPSIIRVKEAARRSRVVPRLAAALGLLALLTPIGLYLPQKFGAGAAWGEWGSDEIGSISGYVPRGLAQMESLWHAPMPDYALRGSESAPLPSLSIAYILCAIIGILSIAIVSIGLKKIISRGESNELASGVDASAGGV